MSDSGAQSARLIICSASRLTARRKRASRVSDSSAGTMSGSMVAPAIRVMRVRIWLARGPCKSPSLRW